jgi:hypothetical protein
MIPWAKIITIGGDEEDVIFQTNMYRQTGC